MQDVRGKYVPPSVRETSFNCPHCGALAKQNWFFTFAEPMKKDDVPLIMDDEKMQRLPSGDQPEHERIIKWAKRMASGRPFLDRGQSSPDYSLRNVSLSQCYNCNDIAIWIFDRLEWPQHGETPLSNPDLPEDVRADYDEASTILDLSPRGAAALLRLAIQKLCMHLGETGKNINDDIAALVRKGLDVRIQQALDVVRVIGNSAVHPGQIELRDDRATAEKLFALVNLIAERMISEPKHVEAMFNSLPEGALKQIERRDAPEKK